MVVFNRMTARSLQPSIPLERRAPEPSVSEIESLGYVVETERSSVPEDFSRPEVLAILKEYYAGLQEKVEIKLHGAATGEAAKK